ncbi:MULTISPECIES: APC family permease [unclassified Nitratiruptor]|uniref:APC family permease n=1 Tax=unclassified Nitratiruptor TaxID=2624044 RepID=UPI0019153957|nr:MULTISPECIES: APC family permease [unclassified Nitratiruptor]BCD60489.1 amino acid transporter [Nitratiruptor sp. YY08-10]BCD64022.1 amino acid transporter [Nitratiruptor sp. YY08-14]
MDKKIGFWEAYSIGVGGMIGGGIFAVLGLTILLAKGAAPISFLFAGIIALITSYSYAKLSVKFPSEGGTVEFLVQGFGNSLFSAYLNTLLLASYIIMLALYSYAFGSYANALFFGHEIAIYKKIFIIFVIVFFTFLNFLGAYVSGKTEDLMVFLKVAILLLFSIFGFFSGDFSKLSPDHYESFFKILTGGLIIFLAYEGFELIANTAADIEEPEKNLPKAYYASVITTIFIYVLVATVAVANLTYEEVQKYSDFALAVAAKPFLGDFGFILIGIAALLSTSSAINATLYGGARVSYLIAKTGGLPKGITKKVWKNGSEGLLILALLSIIFATFFNLENISIAGSLGFLIIFASVNFVNFKLHRETHSNRWISFIGFVLSITSIFVLIGYNYQHNPENLKSSFLVLIATFLFELIYRSLTKVRLQTFIDPKLKKRVTFLQSHMNYLLPIFKQMKHKYQDLHIYKLPESISKINLLFVSNADHNAIQKEFYTRLNNEIKHDSEQFVTLRIQNNNEKIPKNAQKIM